ncbi:putative NUDIX domain-containing protein [Rosellinia necatrix]|uniref:Putative NUDIX domain-containing protein n=1 Tax=Rosellinia necatrix TaxID=77044 RepID=A0A1S8A8K9_ROSNE|nr:putative NUDIX domain-containing protein [Rosellinia necatrix]GAW26445.1 putative NUDIX domain-containing protein [Rosellinia necatrix]
MAANRWKSTLYPSDLFVEACGAIVFDTSTHPEKVCLLYHAKCDEWLLPKGRRNCNETRQAAVRREVREESGYGIALRPLRLITRAPSDLEPADVGDVPRVYDDITEPFMLDVRDLGTDMGVKLVWWFVAELDGTCGEGEAQFKPTFLKCDRALERLTFQKDRDVLRRAMELMELMEPPSNGASA